MMAEAFDAAARTFGDLQQALFEGAVQPLMFAAGLGNLLEDGYRATGWLLVGLLQLVVAAYGIKLEPEPDYVQPKDTEWAFMVTGYSECIDSFFAFGLFKAAKDTGFFPPELVDTFEPVVKEEGRHILFFVNWISWHRRNMPWWRRPYFELKVLAVWMFLIWERIGIASDVGNGQQDWNFTVNGANQLGADVDIGELLAICVSENDRRLAPYDQRLKRPRFVPFMARLALKFVGPKKKAAA